MIQRYDSDDPIIRGVKECVGEIICSIAPLYPQTKSDAFPLSKAPSQALSDKVNLYVV